MNKRTSNGSQSLTMPLIQIMSLWYCMIWINKDRVSTYTCRSKICVLLYSLLKRRVVHFANIAIKSILLVLKPQYSGIIRAIWYMLVPWHLSSSGHHQPRYWLNRKNGTLFSMRNGFNHQCPHRHCEMVESANTFYISWSKFCMKIVVSMETGHGLLLSAHMSLGTCKVGIFEIKYSRGTINFLLATIHTTTERHQFQIFSTIFKLS